MITGGEPFLYPDLHEIVEAVTARVAVTILTNATVYLRGNRRRTLLALDRDLVTLQIFLDSATPDPHDRYRGQGSFARAGSQLARTLGFRVRIAATIDTSDADEVDALRELLDAEGIPAADQIIHPRR